MYALYACIFVIGLCKSMCIIQGFPYLIEAMPFPYRNLVGTCNGLFDKALLIGCTFYLKYYGRNWIVIMIPAILCIMVGYFLSLFLQDSPQYHYDKGNFKRAKIIFIEISNWNGVEDIDPLFDFQFVEPEGDIKKELNYLTMTITESDSNGEAEKMKKQQESVIDMALEEVQQPKKAMFSTRIEYYQYGLCVLVWCVVLLNENMLSFMLKTYQGDIYDNMFVLIISGAIASYLAFFLIRLFQPALALTIAFVIMSISGGFIYPSMSKLNFFFPNVAINELAMGVLSLAKLGAGSAHHLAALFAIWHFNAR